jgi:predicted NBD/HSP70 family sugar kinase
MLMGKNGIPLNKLIGIGVSSPGPLDYRGGVILDPPNFVKFRNIPVASLIREKFDIPVHLENNAVLLAIMEYYYGLMKNYRNSMFVIISNGIGSCVMIDGRLFRGSAGLAGELGHTSIDIDGEECSCGNHGCLELYAAMAALKKRFGFEGYNAVVDRAYNSDPQALRIIDYEADFLACALVGAVNLFDLDSIILYGEFNYRPELLISKIRQRISERSIIKRSHEVAVIPSGLKAEASICSSTAAVLSSYFNQEIK